MSRDESFKKYEEIKRPDIRSERIFPFSLLGLHEQLARIGLSEEVPQNIGSHFNTGKNAYLYSWFHYPLRNVAEAHLFTTLEMALRCRLTGALHPSSKSVPGMARLLKDAHARGLFRISALPAEAGCGLSDEQINEFIDVICSLRNDYSHGSPTLIPRLWPMYLIASLISQVFMNIEIVPE